MNRIFKKIDLKKFIVAVFIISVMISIVGYGEILMSVEEIELNTVESISQNNWQKLSGKKIFFAHQSVGKNIIAGIQAIKKNHSFIKLNIIEGRNSEIFSNGVFAHDRVGKNHDPKSKIDDFYSIISDNRNVQIDVAFLKLCFVDIDATSDLESVFKYYRTKMKLLKEEFPEVLFIHFTVPLIRSEKKSKISYAKNILKKITRKKNDHFFADENNVARNRFNSLLLNEYKGQEPVFDIAKIESTKLNGQRSFFRKSGEIFYSLVPEYTNDAGHLNETGRKIVAEQLLLFLINLPESKIER